MSLRTLSFRSTFVASICTILIFQGCGDTEQDSTGQSTLDVQESAKNNSYAETEISRLEEASESLIAPSASPAIDASSKPADRESLRLSMQKSEEFSYAGNAPSEIAQAVPQPDSDAFVLARVRQETSNEGYSQIVENGFLSVAEKPRSTFSIDVDTASYANVRRFLESGQIPPADAVRVEELINYFTYDDQPPQDGRPFSVSTEVANCPWDHQRKLVRIGLKGQVVEQSERQPANLVFLIDVSGSMRTANKLPLVKRSLHRLLEELDKRDRISIVTYASGVRTVLAPTPAHQQHRITQAIDSLVAGGSTNGSAGLQLAYQVAQQEFVKFGTNRVILCSDGDFNVGITDQRQLVELISQAAKTNIFLSVLGFGTGNYQDSIAEKLADYGNGNYAYIDSYSEARKVLVDQMTGTLETIAKDVKIQVEFNPTNVSSYRLIGYENRLLATRDFRDDQKDAGEIGAGHSVTALYEVVPPNVEMSESDVPELRYQKTFARISDDHLNELLTVRVRYKLPTEETGNEFAHPVADAQEQMNEVSADFRFATSVAAFGMILRDSKFASNITWGDVRYWAKSSLGNDEKGYRTEFLNLLAQAERLIDRPSSRSEVSYTSQEHPFEISPQSYQIRSANSKLSFNQYDSETLVAMLIVIGVATGMAAIFKNSI